MLRENYAACCFSSLSIPSEYDSLLHALQKATRNWKKDEIFPMLLAIIVCFALLMWIKELRKDVFVIVVDFVATTSVAAIIAAAAPAAAATTTATAAITTAITTTTITTDTTAIIATIATTATTATTTAVEVIILAVIIDVVVNVIIVKLMTMLKVMLQRVAVFNRAEECQGMKLKVVKEDDCFSLETFNEQVTITHREQSTYLKRCSPRGELLCPNQDSS